MKKNKAVLGLGLGALVILALGAILIGGKAPSDKQTSKQENNSVSVSITESIQPQEGKIEGIYTLDDIALHSKPEDCWFAVEGSVYDVTKYIEMNKHPGGEAILEGCGKDATELFNTKAGRGEPHSEKANNYLENFKIGKLE